MSTKKRVFVGMSGGVDSSVSASILVDAGYDVTGVFIKVWEAPFLPCTWREERRDAQRVAAHLGIPLLTLDLADVYKKSVVDTFVSAYARGETPNPDVLCNKEIKFGAFYDFAKREGADYIATGHYAVRGEEEGRATLLRSADTEKDQTYFLWTISQEVLRRTLFPVGAYVKDEVRTIAKKKGLPTAQKKDSQGICFLGDVDMAIFLKEFISVEPGNVEDDTGKVIGTHDGALLYTLGERHGFRVGATDTESRPYYVVAKDVTRNVLVVARRSPSGEDHAHEARMVEVGEWHTISGESVTSVLPKGNLSALLRYRQDPFSVTWEEGHPHRIVLSTGLHGIAVGQSAVLYREGECLGGGIITSVGR
jgi:tRNA-specific 2-thiouridylase